MHWTSLSAPIEARDVPLFDVNLLCANVMLLAMNAMPCAPHRPLSE